MGIATRYWSLVWHPGLKFVMLLNWGNADGHRGLLYLPPAHRSPSLFIVARMVQFQHCRVLSREEGASPRIFDPIAGRVA
jgi:hypothetical protein